MAEKPQKSPDAGLWEYGNRTCRHVANAVWWLFRAIARNRSVLLGVFWVARAAVKLIAASIDLFRHF